LLYTNYNFIIKTVPPNLGPAQVQGANKVNKRRL